MLVIHHLGVSQSERVIWLCEELGLAYELVRYERDAGTRLAPAEYKALHPFGTAPVIDDGALRLAESGAIVEYLIHIYAEGRLAVSPESSHYAEYLYWWHFANASFVPAALMDGLVRRLGATDPVSKSLAGRLDLAYEMVEARLSQADYFAGDEFTAADILMFFPLTTMRAFSGRDVSSFPGIAAYLRRVGDRPAYRRAMAKANPQIAPMLS